MKLALFGSRRRLLVLLLLLALPALAWFLWSPGADVRDGRHDRGTNGLWMQHGWLGDDSWFTRNHKEDHKTQLRDPAHLQTTAAFLRSQHITDVFPHLCPCSPAGQIAPADDPQVERFLDAFTGFRVMPWVGGVRDVDTHCENPAWRKTFIASCTALLTKHPRLAGVHLNIEPMPSGDPDFLTLLEELRAALPQGKILSVAAYPPPTLWQRTTEVHWDETYFRAVAGRADQMVVMMYDTGLGNAKLYRKLMDDWTTEILARSGRTEVLLGVPAYDDAGVTYHDPRTENLENSLAGIHAALNRAPLPPNYRGISLYSDWQMNDQKWAEYRQRFAAPAP